MDVDIERDDNDNRIEVEELGDSRFRTQFHVANLQRSTKMIFLSKRGDYQCVAQINILFESISFLVGSIAIRSATFMIETTDTMKQYFRIIHGTQTQNKSRIEQDTKTEIKIPEFGQDGDIIILGSSAANVKAARRQINTIVVSSRMNKKPTHFISIPMNKPDVMENFTRFQEAVLRDCKSVGIEESIFVKASKVHLTMGVMCLMDNEERILASKLLTDAKEKVIMPLLQGHLPIKIRIKGLAYMRDDPKHIHVLFANVEELDTTSGIIQQLADGIVNYFNKEGLVKKGEHGRDTVQLHVTLLNTKYRKSLTQDARVPKWRQRRKSFDGTDILEKFGEFEFGVMELSEIHLSLLGFTGPDGYYQPTFVISIP